MNKKVHQHQKEKKNEYQKNIVKLDPPPQKKGGAVQLMQGSKCLIIYGKECTM